MAIIDRKGQILEEATVLFYENGYDNTSIRELAKAAGLSVAGVYYFFKDKEEILFTILTQSINDLIKTIKASIIDKNDPKKNIRRMIENLLRHVIKHKMDIIILNREDSRLNTEQKETIMQKRSEAFLLLKNEMSRLNELGEIKIKSLTSAVFMIFSMTTWFIKWYNPKGPLTLEELAEDMSDILFTGILKGD